MSSSKKKTAANKAATKRTSSPRVRRSGARGVAATEANKGASSARDSGPRGDVDPPSPPQPAVAADLVVLRNISTEVFVANLTHEDYCRQADECLCRWVTLRLRPQRMDGSGGIQEQRVRRNASLTILAKKQSRPLHRAVLGVPGVKEALRAPDQRLISMTNGG